MRKTVYERRRRRTPIQHTVKAHTRDGKSISSYTRGTGVPVRGMRRRVRVMPPIEELEERRRELTPEVIHTFEGIAHLESVAPGYQPPTGLDTYIKDTGDRMTVRKGTTFMSRPTGESHWMTNKLGERYQSTIRERINIRTGDRDYWTDIQRPGEFQKVYAPTTTELIRKVEEIGPYQGPWPSPWTDEGEIGLP